MARRSLTGTTAEKGVILIVRHNSTRPAVRYTWPDGYVEVRYELGGVPVGITKSSAGQTKVATPAQAATFRPLKR